jgi:membrane fusion protein, multidrug efflux system
MKKKLICTLIILIVVMAGVFACSSKKQKKPASPPVPVMVETAHQETIPITLSGIGNVEAYQSISIKAQITGLITKVHFTQGQDVKKGDPLLDLDCRSVEAELKKAQANLLKDTAEAENARVEYKRYARLIEKNYVARQEYDRAVTNLQTLEATLKADKAIVDSSRVQMQYCSIYSPIDGRTGALKVDQGNIVNANDTEITTVNQIQPVKVSFAIPEKELADIKKHMTNERLQMQAFISGDTRPEAGELNFVDNFIDKTTGTIILKGVFANKDKRLLPGQYVDVVLNLANEKDAILVPSQSIEQAQEGQFVFVLMPDLTVAMRTVTIGRTFQNETVILNGLKPGERVVTDGQMQLKPGTKVSIKEKTNKIPKEK